jgi:hypothetical protein
MASSLAPECIPTSSGLSLKQKQVSNSIPNLHSDNTVWINVFFDVMLRDDFFLLVFFFQRIRIRILQR